MAMKFPRRKFLHMVAGGVALPALSRIASAQAYPTRLIRLVVPFPPGGGYDLIARPWADKMKSLLGAIVVENIGGGAGSQGAAAVARAIPDGYTLLVSGTNVHVNEALLKSRPLYDPVKDLDPISCIGVGFWAIAIHPSVPARTLKEFIAYAKANPGKLSYGHSGVGTVNHLVGELFKSLAGTPDIVPVPYRGAGPVIADLISGQIPMGSVGLTTQLLELHRTGKLRVLAVTSPARLAGAPDFPTATEAGLPGLVARGPVGLLAPAGTPRPIIDQIVQATHAALADRGYQQALIEGGWEPTPDSSPEKFERMLADDVAHWTPLVKALALKID
jgi:tripartite-type tricarboxylate transporter receptor subunit TctC